MKLRMALFSALALGLASEGASQVGVKAHVFGGWLNHGVHFKDPSAAAENDAAAAPADAAGQDAAEKPVQKPEEKEAGKAEHDKHTANALAVGALGELSFYKKEGSEVSVLGGALFGIGGKPKIELKSAENAEAASSEAADKKEKKEKDNITAHSGPVMLGGAAYRMSVNDQASVGLALFGTFRNTALKISQDGKVAEQKLPMSVGVMPAFVGEFAVTKTFSVFGMAGYSFAFGKKLKKEDAKDCAGLEGSKAGNFAVVALGGTANLM